MRVVISHFFNEEYLLPWWLQHHLPMFDYGVMINHGSTDNSADIVRQYAPNWRLVNSRLTEFDSALTDLEVSNYESELPPSWKVALNTTEFLMPDRPLVEIEQDLRNEGRVGCSCSGMIIVDTDRDNPPTYDKPLVLQKHSGIDDNSVGERDPNDRAKRVALGLDIDILRNRFYHSNVVGMYGPGRHNSFHPDFAHRRDDLFVFYYAYAPWTPEGIARKTQIKNKLKPSDVARGWGTKHSFTENEWEDQYNRIVRTCCDLRQIGKIDDALKLIECASGTVHSIPTSNGSREIDIDYARLLNEERQNRLHAEHLVSELRCELAVRSRTKYMVRSLGRKFARNFGIHL